MLTRILAAGLLAGLLSGTVVAAIQHATTVPLILKAEAYEQGFAKKSGDHSAVSPAEPAVVVLVHGITDANGDEPSFTPGGNLQRVAYTSIATIGTAVGFALMLLAAMIASGAKIDARTATFWGLAGFVATGLAPGLGLPPELPGSAAADLVPRQIWWMATASLTAVGLWLLFKKDGGPRIAAGIACLIAPHIVGAPQPTVFASTAPAELAGQFASTSLAVHAVLWTLIGATAGAFWQRIGGDEAAVS